LSTFAPFAYKQLSKSVPRGESGPLGESADLAMQLCLDAGYDGTRCSPVLDVMENESLDGGDLDGVHVMR
jgi:hypothetical protein